MAQGEGKAAVRPRAGAATSAARRGAALSIGLSAVIVTASAEEPRVLTVRLGRGGGEALPSGPLEAEHRTLERGLRGWVEHQTRQKLGYVEQLYTFGDRGRGASGAGARVHALTVAYIALVREVRAAGSADAVWQSWYRYLPWEDWRAGRPAAHVDLTDRLHGWTIAAGVAAERRRREERVGLAFGGHAMAWNED